MLRLAVFGFIVFISDTATARYSAGTCEDFMAGVHSRWVAGEQRERIRGDVEAFNRYHDLSHLDLFATRYIPFLSDIVSVEMHLSRRHLHNVYNEKLRGPYQVAAGVCCSASRATVSSLLQAPGEGLKHTLLHEEGHACEVAMGNILGRPDS